jgi:signal transduction histidine kinase
MDKEFLISSGSKWFIYFLSFSAIFFLFTSSTVASTTCSYINNDTIIFSDTTQAMLIGEAVEITEDPQALLTIKDILSSSRKFIRGNRAVPNLGVSSSFFWIEFKIKNNSSHEDILIALDNPMIDEVEFYTILPDGTHKVKKMGEYQAFPLREYNHPSYIFDLKIPKNATRQYFFRIRGNEQLLLPIRVGINKVILDFIQKKDFLFGIYMGIMLVMFFYNIFIYFTTKDNNYLYYVIYILFVALTQACFQGYTFQFLWPNSPWFLQHSVVFLSAFVGISAAEFAKVFLNTKRYFPSVNKGLYIFYLSYALCIIFSMLGKLVMPLIDITALCISAYLLLIGIIIARKGSRPAKFFLIAWIVFLVGVIVFALKNIGILPYNNITIYTMQIGSALEAILISLALADKINLLKKEKEDTQAQSLQVLKENGRIIAEQNSILETKVKERTEELESSNKHLKETQTQLVNAEKMASLGQLTAGIAHEINNPINFVISNIKPLKRDINDILHVLSKYEKIKDDKDFNEKVKEILELKKSLDLDYVNKEINLLLQGIDEGAYRTLEIVKGLRIFSRLDEDDLKKANINEGLDATLSILNSSLIKHEINTFKDYDYNLPVIECFPGKLNQVFMNILNNAIQSIAERQYINKEGAIVIKTHRQNNNIVIRIKDNGMGISAKNKNKIFEPFFTTKQVGTGTGLGLSIVHSIIRDHNGKIQIESEENLGAEFIITLPIIR